MISAFVPSRGDIAKLLKLALPISTVQVGLMFMGVVDTMVVGRVSSQELAAATLGNLYVYGLAGFGMGTVWAIDPIVSQALGARDHAGAALGIQRGLVLGSFLGLVLMLMCLPADWVFAALGQPADVVPRAALYTWVSAPGMPALLVFITLRQSLQAMKRPQAIVAAIVVGNVVNLSLNLWFVFGRWGVPPLGSLGSAISTLISRVIMITLLLIWARPHLGPVLRPWRREATLLQPLVRLFRLGVPIGLQNSVEFTTFAAISVFAGWIGADALSGHQVALNLASLMFMVPMGMGSAGSVLVGHAIGERDPAHARRIAASALLCGAAFMAISALVLRAFPLAFARGYSNVPGVVAVASSLIPIAGVFQVFDGLQVVSAGVLRGAGDTRAPLIANLLGFWLIGIPVSLWLGFHMDGGVAGLWWGFVAGLAAVAVFLVGRVRVLLARPLERMRLESDPAPGV